MSYLPWHAEAFEAVTARLATLPHALLLTGKAGIGKRPFALALAGFLLCEQRTVKAACGMCQSCRWLAADAHPDFRVIEPEAATSEEGDADAKDNKKKRDISVAQIRSIGDFIQVSAHRGGGKVVFIHPAEAMNLAAANALLKSLEEPPPDTTFLLVSDRPNLLPATVRSRCQKLVLRPPAEREAAQWLATQNVEQAQLALSQAGGAPLAAIELSRADYWQARRLLLDGLVARDFNPVQLAERMSEHPIPQTIGLMQRWTYDLSRLAFGQPIRYNTDKSESLLREVARMVPLEILRYHRELVRFQRVVNHPLSPRLLLEDLMMRYQTLAHT